MKLIEELRKAKGFTAGLILTFDVTLDWFERLVGRHLSIQGVRRLAVLADGRCLSETIATQLPLLHGAGRHYVVQGVAMPRGRFHPKLVLLSGPTCARLYVGSGNLSASGFGRNREIFERWDVGSTDLTVPLAFETARRFVEAILDQGVGQDVSPDLRDVLEHVFGAAILDAKPVDRAGPELFGSPGPLLERLPIPSSPSTTLRIMAPYFDDDGDLVTTLAKRLGAREFEVITDPLRSNLSRRATERIRDCGGEIVAIDDDDRSLHAKVLYAAGPGWEVAVTGSANLSRAAWRGYNAELIVLRRDGDAAAVGQLLAELPRREIADDEWEALWARVEEETERAVDDEQPGPNGIAAWWIDRDRVQVTLRGSTTQVTSAEWFERGVSREVTTRRAVDTRDGPNLIEVLRPDDTRRGAGVVAVRLSEGAVKGRWLLVHDPAELRETARAPSRGEQKVDDLLAAGEGDLDAAGRLVEYLGRIWRRRCEQEEEGGGAQDDESEKETDTEPSSTIRLPDADFIDPRAASRESIRSSAGRSSITLPVRLMQRLLFGDLADLDADAEEGESAKADDEGAEVARVARRVDSDRCARFLRAATAARDAYLEQLRAVDDFPTLARLVDDLQVLAAALHYGARAGGLSPGEFVREMVPVLRAFLGLRTAAFPSALSALTTEQRQEVWSRGEPLLLVALLLYNVWLASYDTTLDEGIATEPGMFGLALWMRHVVRHAPDDELDRVRLEIWRRGPALRSGALWLGDRHPDAVTRLPFNDFVERLLRDVRALLVVERAVGDRLANLSAKPGVRELLEEDMLVMGAGRDGCIALGFVDIDDSLLHRQAVSALLQDGAFMAASVSGDASHLDKMVKVATKTLVPLDLVDTVLDDQRSELRDAIDVLKRLAGD